LQCSNNTLNLSTVDGITPLNIQGLPKAARPIKTPAKLNSLILSSACSLLFISPLPKILVFVGLAKSAAIPICSQSALPEYFWAKVLA